MTSRARVIGISAALLILVGPTLRAATPSRIADAVQAQDQTAVKTLLAKGVDVNAPQADGTTALHWAAHHNDVALADLLLKAGAHVSAANRYGVTPLSLASAHGSAVEMIDKLLKAGADPNTTLKEGETVLMLAARTGNAVAVKLLLAYGADPNRAEGWRKQTALMWSAEENHGEAVKTLIEGGANIHAMSNNRFTALMFAARAGHTEVVEALLREGANANDELRDGTSALTLAALNAHWELGIKLLEWGANATGDDQGWNALHQVALPVLGRIAVRPETDDQRVRSIEPGARVGSAMPGRIQSKWWGGQPRRSPPSCAS
jgi:ankyrin repeat protein